MAWCMTVLATFAHSAQTRTIDTLDLITSSGKHYRFVLFTSSVHKLTVYARHVRVHHPDRDRDDPDLRGVLAQRNGTGKARRRRANTTGSVGS